jgi:glycerol-3-phosphate dehydrogenase (NAD(P)+)
MHVAIIGAGAWGTALAVSAAALPQSPHSVSLWARNAAQLDAMRRDRVNQRYLPGVVLPQSLSLRHWSDADGAAPASGLPSVLADASLIVIASPMVALRGMLQALRGCAVPVVWLCKGFEQALAEQGGPAPVGLMAHEVQSQVGPELHAGVLSGPSFAQEVAQGQPAALVAASADAGVRAALVQAFHGPSLRIYASDDVIGVEVGGAVKNVLAIATGVCDGLGLGLNSRAALMTRGLAEIARLGLALGAERQTFMGLAGMGDLILTCTGDLSRNRQVGLALATGRKLEQILADLGHVAEGVSTAREVARLADQLAIEMPITQAVNAILHHDVPAAEAVEKLLSRDPKSEMQ